MQNAGFANLSGFNPSNVPSGPVESAISAQDGMLLALHTDINDLERALYKILRADPQMDNAASMKAVSDCELQETLCSHNNRISDIASRVRGILQRIAL